MSTNQKRVLPEECVHLLTVTNSQLLPVLETPTVILGVLELSESVLLEYD